MAIEVTMPKLSDTMEEGTVLEWRIKEGDRVRRGDIIAEIETDKAAMEMEAYEDGVVSKLAVAAGDTVAVGTLLAVLSGDQDAESVAATETEGAENEPVSEPEPEVKREPEADKAEADKAEADKAEADKKVPCRTTLVSPAARKLAERHQLELNQLTGSGPGGRIILADVEAVIARSKRKQVEYHQSEQAAGGRERDRQDQRFVKIRRIMARKMTESWQTVPHFYVTFSVDMTDIIRFRKDLGVTINDFILAGVVRSLQEHPWVNSWWVEGEAIEKPNINISMAIATDRGLYNPVVKDCAELSLRELSQRTHQLGQAAHAGKLSPEDLEGGTFTVSNMGMLGVDSFRAIITPPQAAVLAVGTVKGEVIVDESGEPAVAPIMRMTLAADHRILDGADAAEFMATLKSYLEAPVTLISH